MLVKIWQIILGLVTIDATKELQWRDNYFSSCKAERKQTPVVEYYNLHGTEYLFFSHRVTWEEARLLCESYNSRLATLDTMEKAMAVAKSIAQSNIVMEDTWLGGRRINFIWYWIDNETRTNKNEIPMVTNIEDFPPWSRVPLRPTKECLAIDRRSHEHPNFVDLDCRLPRPFICARDATTTCSPVPSKWVQINKHTYTLYHGKVSWQEAATFCRTRGARLAILKSSITINILANSMTTTRPDFETVWIGAHFSYGQWVWMSTGSILNSLTDNSGYPPWRYGRSEENHGCLLLTRHIGDNSSFIAMPCDRKRDFVCEEYTEDEENDWMNEPVKFSYENNTYIIYALEKTWTESRIFCNERGSVLAHLDHMNVINLIIEAMGDHPREISHVWLGGMYNEKTDEWRWIGNGEVIKKNKDKFGFPPWANIENVGMDSTERGCLNLDRSDHVKAHIYGLDCNNRQYFICKITCDNPPPVRNGTWNCTDITDGRQCYLHCDKGLIIAGMENITCTFKNGWSCGKKFFTEFPLCLTSKEYFHRLIKALSHDVQRSVGYYFLMDHSSEAIKIAALKFAANVITAFPLSNNLKAGMTLYLSDSPSYLPFNQTDTCLVYDAIRNLQYDINGNNSTIVMNISRIDRDISTYNGRRVTIIAVIDFQRGSIYVDTLLRFKAAGHHIIIFGSIVDAEFLLPLATIGFDRRLNLFLLDASQLKYINSEFELHGKKSTCPVRTTTQLSVENSTVSPTPIEMSKIIPAIAGRTANGIEKFIKIKPANSLTSTTMTTPVDSDYLEETLDE